jgi:hypothetical protein
LGCRRNLGGIFALAPAQRSQIFRGQAPKWKDARVCRSSPLPQARPLRAQPPRVNRYFRTRVNMGLPPPTADAARAGLRRVWRNAEARRRSGTFAGSRHSDGWRAKNSRSPARDPKAIATPPSTTTSATRSPLCQRQPTWQSGTRTLSPRNAETLSVKGQGQRHRAQHIVAKRETLSNSGARRSESLSRFRQRATATHSDVFSAYRASSVSHPLTGNDTNGRHCK